MSSKCRHGQEAGRIVVGHWEGLSRQSKGKHASEMVCDKWGQGLALG